MRRTCPTLLLTAALVMAACQKENPMQQWVEVSTESYNTAKVALDGTNATWADGDELLVNGTTTAIHHINGHTYIDASAVNATGVNRALYPADLSTSNIGTDNISVNLPAQYRYRTDNGGHQLLAIPMAARSDGASPMLFHHLTGALVFNIVNGLDRPLTLERLTVQSDRYSLSGTRNIDFSALDATSATTPIQDADRTVELIFDGQQLAAGDSLSVTVPIAPVGADNHFTISVSGHHEGTRYSYSRSQTTGGALARNQMGYARTEINSTDNRTQQGPLFNYQSVSSQDELKFLISTPTDFKLMADAISNDWTCMIGGVTFSYKKSKYLIKNDIDMSGLAISPITGFTGAEFDGDSNTISNLTINGADGKCGLFATIGNASIRDITLNNTTLNYTGTGELQISPFICELNGDAEITNCNITNVFFYKTSSLSPMYYGGLIASASYNCTIQSCTIYISDEISNNGQTNYGGLLGLAKARSVGNTSIPPNITINNCTVTHQNLTLKAGGSTLIYGGIVGRFSNSTIKLISCMWTGGNIGLTSTATITSGGLIGRIYPKGSINTTTCKANGQFTISGSTKIYGIFLGQTVVGVDANNFSTCTGTVIVNNDTIINAIGA